MATKSSFRGVQHRGTGTWTATIHVEGGKRYLGSFDNEVDAARAYDRAATKLHKVPILNFREDGSLNPHRKNAKKRFIKSSSYRGVSIGSRGKWEANIEVDGCRHFLGRFEDEAEAARTYDRAVREWKLERPLNFPSRGDGAGTVASTAASSSCNSNESGDESLWSSDEDRACENEEEEEEGKEEEGHSGGAHKKGVREKSPSLQPHKRPRTHDSSISKPSVLPVATQWSGSSCFTDTAPDSSAYGPSVDSTTSPLTAISSASSTPAANAPLPPATAAHAFVSVAVAPAACTHDAITQLRHVVTAARIEARSKEPAEQQRVVRAFAVFNKREMQKDILQFAEGTITNAYAPLNTRREEDRALLLQLFIETFLVES